MDSLRASAMLALIAALVTSGAADAAQREPHFERIGSESGPPFSVVTALHQDRVGFVWIGSRNGLILYDGHVFTTFEHDPSDPLSLSDDAVRTIFEDRHGNLWVGTNSGGLDRLDRATGTFRRFRHDSADPRSLSHDSVYGIAEDESGHLWVGTQRGLNRLDPATGSFERFLTDPSKPGSLSHNYVSALRVDRQGRLWVGTVGGGLNRYDAATGLFDVWRPDPGDPRALGDASVFALLEGESGELWVGTNSGLQRMDMEHGHFRYLTPEPDEVSSATRAIITSLAAGPAGRIWVGTFGGGLKELDPRSGAMRLFRHQDGRPASLPANRVLSLMADRDGGLWVGTWGGGLSRVSESALLLASGADEAPEPDGLEDRDVTALAHDAAGGLWVGMRNGTLLHRSASGTSWRSHPLGNAGSILRILPAREGMIWVGTSQGMARLDPGSGKVSWFRHAPDDPSSLGPGFVPALIEDRAGRLWAGTGEGGLNEINREGRVLRRFQNAPADSSSLSDDYVTALHEDRGGLLWVGTRSGGVNALDPASGRAVRYLPEPDNPGALSHHNVTAIFEDSKGRLWIATGGGGLNRVDRADPAGPVRFTRFTAADGLVNNNVMAILEDDDGTLWLSTKRGLARFAPETGTFTNFDVADGLPSAEFEFGAAVRSARNLLFGSVAWMAAVPAGTSLPAPAPSPTVITSVRGESDELRDERPPWALERLEIPYGTWFSIEVAVLDFNTQHTHAHTYRMSPQAGGWIDLGPRRTITLTDLDPGRYEFVARGRNCQGVWTQTSPPLQIHVIPPFWMTTWFRALSLTILAGAVVIVHRVRLSALERRNRELVSLHEQRERAGRELSLAYDRLRTLARRLEAAKEEERRHIARELHDDLGPALTAVVINLQLLGQEKDQAGVARRLEDSIDLVDRMVQQIRDLSLDLRPPLMDEMGLVGALKGYLETQAERTGLEIDVKGDPELDGLPPETEITVFRLAQEAVTNAIRHAEAARIAVNLRADGDGLEIVVEDDGKGFDVRALLEGPATVKNLGLVGMQERARMIGGELGIESAPGRGTRVRIRIPLEVPA